MSWVRIDDSFPEHPKILEAGGDAGWLHVCALAYCNRNTTDGLIHRNVMPRLSDRTNPLRLAERLVAVGIWERDGADYRIHDYLEYQPSRAEIEAERAKQSEAKAKAGRLGGIASGVARRKHERSTTEAEGQAEGQAEGKQNEAPTRPDPFITQSSSQLTLVTPVCFDDETGKKGNIATEYARLAWEQANQTLIKAPTAFRLSEHLHALEHPDIDRYITEYPTATASEIACWLHGETNTQRYHERLHA